jgi:hypothetical protein
LFPACLHPAVSTIKQTSPASPSLSGEKTLAFGPTTEFSDRLLGEKELRRSKPTSKITMAHAHGEFCFYLL